ATSSPVQVNVALAGPPANYAAFVKLDSTTAGNWVGTYGADGFVIANSAGSLLTYMTVGYSGALQYTWTSPSTDPRALLIDPRSSTRIASTFYNSSSFTFDVNLTD